MKYLYFLVLLFIGQSSIAQNCSLRFSGHVDDTDTREKLPNAFVTIVELNKTIVTNRDGDFSFDSLCAGMYTIEISHVHCETLRQQIKLTNTSPPSYRLHIWWNIQPYMHEILLSTVIYPYAYRLINVI